MYIILGVDVYLPSLPIIVYQITKSLWNITITNIRIINIQWIFLFITTLLYIPFIGNEADNGNIYLLSTPEHYLFIKKNFIVS